MKSGSIGRTVVTCAGVALVGFGALMSACGGDDNGGAIGDDGGSDATKDTSVPGKDSAADTSISADTGADSTIEASAGDTGTDAGADASDAADTGLRCVFPQLDCNGACVSTDTDIANCGACGHACTTGNTCSAGHCSNAVSKVAAGERFACAVKFDGTVWCWGSNDTGELGVAPSAGDIACGAAHCNKTPQQIGGLTTVTSVSTANGYACAVKKDGSVWCWGKNEYGELGHASGSAGDVTCTNTDADGGGAGIPCNPVPSQVAFPGSAAIAAISAGQDVICARTVPAVADAGADGGDAGVQGGDVYCWGDNVHDTVGLAGPVAAPDPTHQPTPTPNKVPIFTSDVLDLHVALGSHHACALRTAGTVWCWGDDLQGRLGTLPGTDGDCAGNICTPKPMQVKVQTVVDAGGDAAGDTVVGAALTTVKAVRAGAGASCALKNDGTVWCWGSDEFAALADKGPYSAEYAHPGARQILSIPAAKSIAQHGATAFAVDLTGSAYGWGDNTFGELGTGSLNGSQCPVGFDAGACVSPPVLGVPHLRDISAGLHLTIGVKSDDTVWAWGKNGHAQLGHAPTTGGDKACVGPLESAPCNATPSQVVIP